MLREYASSINDRFVARYKDKMPPFGPVGYITYKRTYARRIDDGKRTEEWFETVQRAVNGLLKIGAKLTREETEELYDKVFNIKCSFSGRALWQLGTTTVDKLGGDSLQNCWCISCDTPVESFCFTFDELMLGGGVGFNLQREVVFEIPKVKHDVQITRRDEKDVDLIVPDNREGWVDLLRRVLTAFFVTGKSFSYSTICVRGKGTLIKSFGGTASGPEDLCRGIDQIVQVLRSRVGKKLRPIDCLDIMNIIGSIVVAGNVRRSAQIALGDMDDIQYLDAKNWAKGDVPNWRAMSNNSVICNNYEHLPDKFWSGYNGDGEAYGLVNLTNCRRYGRLADGTGYRPDQKVIGTNPCLTGDALVAVADGRVHLTIKQLADEGKDVPVYCLDDHHRPTIRYMRHPRITGFAVPIVKVTLDDGSVIRCTSNHKFLVNDGGYVEAGELRTGDGVRTMTRHLASMKDVFKDASKNSQDYWWVSMGKASCKAEHRMITEFYLGRKLKRGEVVHHRDYDAQNNAISNLEPMSREEHDSMHALDKTGDNNPMRRAKIEWPKEKWDAYRLKHSLHNAAGGNGNYCGITNDGLKRHALELTGALGRRFSNKEWVKYARENGLPQKFSKWREDHLGGIHGLARWAAMEKGIDPAIIDADPRTARFYKEVLGQGYEATIKDGVVYVAKKCEKCGKEFDMIAQAREQGFCSISCANSASWGTSVGDRRRSGINAAHKTRRDTLRSAQLSAYTKLKFDIGREPLKEEWETACAEAGISREISRKSSPFRLWNSLKEEALTFNHRVVSVEPDGIEDVYNGTVDEFHNFFCGGFGGETNGGKQKFIYLNNRQCGEVPLESGESCNLAEIFLPNLEDEAEFRQVADLMCKVTKTISCLSFIHDGTNDVVRKNHRLGISVTGFLQAQRFHDERLFDRVYKHVERTDKEYSKVMGVEPSIKLTTTKPSGTLSLVAGCTPGVHPAYAPCYIRRIRMASGDALVALCRKNGYHVEPVKNFDGSVDRNTMVVSFPVKVPPSTTCAKDVTAVQQLDYQKWLQTNWADNSVSVTVYYRKEELPAIKDWLAENYDKSVKTVSFLLHSGHGFTQAPYEEISEDEYNRLAAESKPITRIDNDQGGNIDGAECSAGACPVK
jgi:ribonucleotide reductase alpha subunit